MTEDEWLRERNRREQEWQATLARVRERRDRFSRNLSIGAIVFGVVMAVAYGALAVLAATR